MSNATTKALSYNKNAAEAGWDSPKRAQNLVKSFVVPGSLVLDIGIGTGQAVKGYQEKGALVIGVDHDPAMIEVARTTTGVSDIRFGDINGVLPIENLEDRVDVVQAIGVLEFATKLHGTLGELATCMKDSGVIVFTAEISLDESDTNRIEYFPDPDITVFRHSPEEIEMILKSLGLNLLHRDIYAGYNRGDENVAYAIFLAQKLSKSASPFVSD